MVQQPEALDPAHPAHEYFGAREAMVLKAFATMVAPHVADPHSTARHIYALMDGLVLRWLRADQAFNIVREWDRAAAMLLPGRRADRR
jgi:hypothetical protein